MADVTISLDGISSASIPELIVTDVRRQITPGIRDSYRDVPGRSGSWLFREAAGDRSLSVEFAAVGDLDADRREALRLAAAFLYGDGQGRRKLVVSDETDRFYWAKLAAEIEAQELLRLGRFTATFRTAPYALSTAISTEVVAASGTATITSAPDHAAFFEPSIEVTATGTNAGGFAIDVDGTTITYDAPIVDAEKVTISTISATVTSGADADTELDGTFAAADLAMTSVSGDFPVLTPGDNVVTLTGPISASFRYRERFV